MVFVLWKILKLWVLFSSTCKRGVTWNLLNKFYDNIGIDLCTGFYVPLEGYNKGENHKANTTNSFRLHSQPHKNKGRLSTPSPLSHLFTSSYTHRFSHFYCTYSTFKTTVVAPHRVQRYGARQCGALRNTVNLILRFFLYHFYMRWACDIKRPSTTTQTNKKHHHHGDGASCPSSNVGSMNPHRPNGGRPCSCLFQGCCQRIL